jgi:hypothetical protein
VLLALTTALGSVAGADGDLEREIEAELRRQEEMLRSRDLDNELERVLQEVAVDDANLAERANPRIAPKAPTDRQLPIAIFDSETVEIPAGTWGNSAKILVVKRSLDADRDGKPEQIRYFDETTGVILRKEADRDYNGEIDTWQTYAGGALVERTLDNNDDGQPDDWETYRAGRMTERRIDRNADGGTDAFYTFSGDSLVEERHDRNDDGTLDLTVTYTNRQKVKSAEDRSGNGRIDTWIYYAVVGSEEIPARIERDTDGSGNVDVTETFETSSGKPVLSRREEDKNGDGETDVTSIYRNGKLFRREISNPDLMP